MQTNSLSQITRALRALVDNHMDELIDIDYDDKEEARSSEETDALEVRYHLCTSTPPFQRIPDRRNIVTRPEQSIQWLFPDVQEARLAIEQVVIPKGESVQLLPRPSSIISSQVDLIESFSLQWEVIGQEPNAYVRILPHFAPKEAEAIQKETPAGLADSESSDDLDHTQNGITRLPFLPD